MKLTENRIKQIIKEEMELMEMDFDPMSLMLGAGAIYALYKMFFGTDANSAEEALNAVRSHINKKAAEAEVNRRTRRPSPPAQGDMQDIKARARRKLAQRKAQREM